MQEIDLLYDIHILTSILSIGLYFDIAFVCIFKIFDLSVMGRRPMSPISDDGNIRNWGSFFSLSIYHNFLPKATWKPRFLLVAMMIFFTQSNLPAVSTPETNVPKDTLRDWRKNCVIQDIYLFQFLFCCLRICWILCPYRVLMKSLSCTSRDERISDISSLSFNKRPLEQDYWLSEAFIGKYSLWKRFIWKLLLHKDNPEITLRFLKHL